MKSWKKVFNILEVFRRSDVKVWEIGIPFDGDLGVWWSGVDTYHQLEDDMHKTFWEAVPRSKISLEEGLVDVENVNRPTFGFFQSMTALDKMF